jgi:hypothetical protein
VGRKIVKFDRKKEHFQKTKRGAINIHPTPPEHPGLGILMYFWTNETFMFVLDMKLIDSCQIYRTIRFPVLTNEVSLTPIEKIW